MSKDSLRLSDYLAHIIQAIERIGKYTADIDEAEFLKNQMTQDAVVRNFEVIGEASRNVERVDPEFASKHPDLPLKFAYDMRNQLAHGYFQVDLGIVWRTAKHNLPGLAEQVRSIAASAPTPDEASLDQSITKSSERPQ